MMKKFIKKGDIIIIVCVLVICALMFLPRLFNKSGTLVATVYENGEITHEIELDKITESYELKINGGVLLLENGAVSYIEADCPDKICVKTGTLRKGGDTASCVPNKTVVKVSNKKAEKDIDVITY